MNTSHFCATEYLGTPYPSFSPLVSVASPSHPNPFLFINHSLLCFNTGTGGSIQLMDWRDSSPTQSLDLPPCSLLPSHRQQSSSNRHYHTSIDDPQPSILRSSTLTPHPFSSPHHSIPPSLIPSSGSPTHPSTYQLSFIIPIKPSKSNVLGVVSVSEVCVN